MLVHCFAWRTLIRIIGGLQTADHAALLIVDVENIQRVLFGGLVRDPEQFRGAVISLHRLAFGARFVQFAADVHAFVREQIQAVELLMGGSAWMAQIRHQCAAPGFLNDDLAGSRIGVAGREHFRVYHRVEQGVAMNPGAMLIGQLGRLDRQKPLKVPRVDRRPGKRDGQPQNQCQVRFTIGRG